MNISVVPNYSYIFPFENEINPKSAQSWLFENWTFTFYVVAVYLFVIFSGKYLLRNRKGFELRGYLIAWNTFLAIFSFMGAYRTAPELLHVLRYHGFIHSVCVCSNVDMDQVAGFWTVLFVFSKIPELGDTIFVVLRKQPLNFLHWYHHSTVLIYASFSYGEGSSMGRWFVVMNYCVHSIMYTYYALRAARIKVPRVFAMITTSLQLLQMFVGCALNLRIYYYLQTLGSEACDVTYASLYAALAMYFSYFVLFTRLFYKSYLSSSGNLQQKTKKIHSKNEEDSLKSKVQ